jgi:PAS domain S-box-containing protein
MMKILIVDDNAAGRKLLRTVLTSEGHSTVEAEDGSAALKTLERERIDAVISDILMPIMDGYRLCYEVHKREGLRDIPFIIYSATYTSLTDEKLALDFGADRFIRKPASPAVITKVIREVMEDKEGRRTKRLQEPDESLVMREYSEALVKKLEEKSVELAEANKALEERARLAEFNADVANTVAHKGTLREILQLCAEAMVRHLDPAFARIWTYNREGNVLELQASAGMYTHIDGGHSRVPVGRFKIGLIASERKPHLTNDVIGDARVHDQDWAKREGMAAFAGYPLLVEDRLVGVMAMFARRPLSRNTLDAMAAVAKEIAVGIEQKLTEDELRRSEERFRELAENIHEIFFVSGRNGSPVYYVSPAYEQITGRSCDELYRNPLAWLESIHPADRPRVACALQMNPENLDQQYRILKPDGETRWLHSRAFPVTDANGQVVRVVGIVEEITERKLAEQRAQWNLDRIRALHEIDLAITSTLDLRGVLEVLLEKIGIFLPYPAATTVRLLNRETGILESLACRGLSKEEWTAQDSKTIGRRARKILETRAPLTVRNVQTEPGTSNPDIFRKYGLVSHLGVPLIAKDEPLGVLGLYTKEDHEFSQEEIEFLNTLAGQAAIAIHNAQLYENIHFSRKELELTNAHLERSLKQLSGLYTALAPLALSETIQQVMNGIIERLMDATGADAALIRVWDNDTDTYPVAGQRGFPEDYLKRFDRLPRGGSVDWIVKHGAPIIASDVASEPRLKSKSQLELGLCSCAMLPLKVDDEVRGVVHLASRKLGYFDEEQKAHLMAIARQMGIALENRELFEKLRASRDELEKANKVKDEFLSLMSHELRTPLIVIIGYAALLKDTKLGQISEQQEKALERMLRSADEQLSIINSLLQATLLDTQTVVPVRECVEAGDLLDSLKLEHDFQSNNSEIRLIWDPPAEPAAITTDSAKLKQILHNLISNAMKFTDKGKVTVSARKTGDGQSVSFKVTDTGIGIPKEKLTAIFDKLYQVDSSDTRLYGGVGLGLYIAKRYAELLGATLKVESEPDEGSTFTVTLPCEAQ